MRSSWPLNKITKNIPQGEHPGAFGTARKFDVHTGVDLYCDPWDDVMSIEDGAVVSIFDFTGSNAGSAWWEDTKAVMIEGASGVILYGEIVPKENLCVGQKVWQGEIIGAVKTVLKKDKGLPMTMLHLELYEPGVRDAVCWALREEVPAGLLDPTSMLIDIRNRNNSYRLDAFREMTPKVKKCCENCEQEFETKFGRFCSTKCRVSAYRKRKRNIFLLTAICYFCGQQISEKSFYKFCNEGHRKLFHKAVEHNKPISIRVTNKLTIETTNYKNIPNIILKYKNDELHRL